MKRILTTQGIRQSLEDSSKELLRYGNVRYDFTYVTTNDNHIRIRVLEYNDKLFVHRMLNGELKELTEI